MKKILILGAAILTIAVGVLAYVKPGQTKLIALAAVTTEAATETATNAEMKFAGFWNNTTR